MDGLEDAKGEEEVEEEEVGDGAALNLGCGN